MGREGAFAATSYFVHQTMMLWIAIDAIVEAIVEIFFVSLS